MIDDFWDLPDNFRQDIFEKILKAIDRHESVTIIAPPGIGKTLLLQMIPQKTKNAVYLDLNSQWDKQTFPENVIILDHAEALLRPENAGLLLLFRSLRDTNCNRSSFIFAINPNIAGNFDLFGPLKPTILENILYLGPLNSQDARAILAKSERLLGGKLSSAQKKTILTLSGGIPRLIKRLAKLYLDGIDPATDLKIQNDLQEIRQFLSNHPQIKWDIPLLNKNADNPKTETIGGICFSQNLSRQEYDLAKLLLAKEGQLTAREEMIEAVWKTKMYDVNEHALDQMLHRLRHKLTTATPKVKLIVFRGRGVQLQS